VTFIGRKVNFHPIELVKLEPNSLIGFILILLSGDNVVVTIHVYFVTIFVS